MVGPKFSYVFNILGEGEMVEIFEVVLLAVDYF